MPYTASLMFSSATRAKIACCLLTTAWIYVAWPDLKAMVQIYKSSVFNYHGFLILPLVLVLIRQQRNNLKRVGSNYSSIGLLVLLLSCMFWLTAKISGLTTTAQAAMLSMLPAIVLTSYGPKIFAKLMLPLMSIFLLLPLGEELYAYTQDFYAHVLVKALVIAKQSVYWDQITITINNIDYPIASLCPVLKYASVYITLATLFACTITKRIPVKILIITSSVLLPVITSIISALALILCVSWLKLQAQSHTTLVSISWTSVAIGLSATIIVGVLLRGKERIAYKNDGIDWRTNINTRRSAWLPATLLLTTVLCLLPLTAKELQSHIFFRNNWINPSLMPIPSNEQIALSITYDSIKTAHLAYDQQIWQHIKTTEHKIKINKRSIPVQETILKRKQDTKVIWNLHYTNGHFTNNKIVTKILESYYSLSHQGAKVANINLTTNINSNLNIGRERLTESLSELVNKTKHTWK